MKIKKIEIAEKEMEFDLFPSLLSVNDFKEYKTNISVRPDKKLVATGCSTGQGI